MTEKVFFKFEGSFLTKTFRNYYWDGSHTYEESVEYIVQFFVLPTEKDKNYVRTKIAPGILNGTKKLVGEENYDLEDDDAVEEYHKSPAYRKDFRKKAKEKRIAEDLPKITERYSSEIRKRQELVYIKMWDYASTKDPYGNNYWAVPDEDLDSEYGLIAPNGDWYSCDFAMHEDLATHLVERDTNLRLAVLEKYECQYGSVKNYALDYLQSIGWLMIHNLFPSGNTYPAFHSSKYRGEEDLPQAMLNTLYDWRYRQRMKDKEE